MTSFLPILGVDQGRPTVSSLQLAEHFGIKHQHVLRDIRAILRKVPAEWGLSNFGQSEYLNAQNKEQPTYHLTRDGFTLLAMGYNSARAIEWKLRYIAAFNALERAALEGAARAALSKGVSRALALKPSEREQIKKIRGYLERGFSQREIAAVMGLHSRRVGCMVSLGRSLGLVEVTNALR